MVVVVVETGVVDVVEVSGALVRNKNTGALSSSMEDEDLVSSYVFAVEVSVFLGVVKVVVVEGGAAVVVLVMEYRCLRRILLMDSKISSRVWASGVVWWGASEAKRVVSMLGVTGVSVDG